jgi:hypothetical protein
VVVVQQYKVLRLLLVEAVVAEQVEPLAVTEAMVLPTQVVVGVAEVTPQVDMAVMAVQVLLS